MDNIYSSVRGTPKQYEVDDLNNEFNEIIKTDLGILSDRAEGDVTDFITKMFSNSQKNNAMLGKELEDIFNMKESQIASFLTEAYQNRLIRQSDIHEVSHQLNELREAILITRDSIVASDFVDGHMSRSLSFENAGSIENADEYIPIIEQIEKKFKLKEKIKNFIIPRTLEFGEFYAYIIPHAKIFENFMNKKSSTSNQFLYNESTLYDNCNSYIGESVYDIIGDDIKKDVKDGKCSKNKLTDNLVSQLKNISISNDDIPLSFLTEGVYSMEEFINLCMSENITEASNKSSVNPFTRMVNKLDSGIMDETNSKQSSEFSEVRDCYIKLIDPMHLIPVKIMDYTIGYYYIHDTEIVSGDINTPYNLYDMSKDNQSLINLLSTEIVKSFDKKFLEDNMEFKSLIVEALQYFNFNNRKIKFQYIPKDYIVAFKINEDEDGNGTSIIEPALFYAKLYLMLLLFKMSSIVAYSNDTRVHYIRQSGIDKNVTNKIQEIARKMQSRQVNMLDMFSYTSMVNKVANGNDRFIPVGRSGERGIETEILGGQDIPLNTELMEMLKSSYISSTGVPAVIMNYINEADYAKTLELANTRYQARIVSNQLDFNSSITEMYQKMLGYSTNIPQNAIELFRFTFAPPKYASANISSDLVSSFSGFAEFATTLVFTDDEINNPQNSEMIRLFKLKLAKERLPSINVDRYVELKDEAQVESIPHKINNPDGSQ